MKRTMGGGRHGGGRKRKKEGGEEEITAPFAAAAGVDSNVRGLYFLTRGGAEASYPCQWACRVREQTHHGHTPAGLRQRVH